MPLPFLQLLAAATMATSVSFSLLPPTPPSLPPLSLNQPTLASTLPSLPAPMPPTQVPSSAVTPKTRANGESLKSSLPPSRTKLATTVANINDHIHHLNKPPIASVTNSDATNATALSSITSSVTDLQQQVADLKRENDQLRQKQPRRPRTRRDNGNYCWTHGYRVRNQHTSATCQNKAPGHQDNATRANTMGGSEANKPSTT